MKWFKHDSNASTDAKIQKVLVKYGLSGYGLYFFCLELISRNVEKHNLTFELEHDAQLISAATFISEELVTEMMTFMIKLNLFQAINGVISCGKMATRTDEYTQKLIKNNGGITMLSRQTPDNVTTMSDLREEKRIEQKRTEKKTITKKFKKPSISEVREYCKERNNSIDPESFIDFYETSNWMRGKTKIKDWKSCVRTWERNDKKKSADEDDYAV